ncbi:MAG: type I 3-dehydroquinate dehydratase, partial [Lachnospiraceae bacterium]|nr:type I 3-dehydroquinate dehydratase [Lachnospiraceae bacterium]
MGKVVKVKNVYIGQGKPKICAIVLGETVSEILAMVEQANQIDCDLIEFRADYYANILDPEKAKDVAAKVRHACRKPIIFTCRRKEEGGKQAISLDAYKKLLKMVSDCYYAELIDVEA